MKEKINPGEESQRSPLYAMLGSLKKMGHGIIEYLHLENGFFVGDREPNTLDGAIANIPKKKVHVEHIGLGPIVTQSEKLRTPAQEAERKFDNFAE